MDGDADIAAVGALLAEPARASVLLALADGRSLAASMLAAEAGVAASTASHHLARLVDAGLVRVESRGRHRYFSLAGPQVGELIEAVARVAPPKPVTSLREGTRAHAVRYARSCYDHLAGRLGIAVADALCDDDFAITAAGARRLHAIGVDVRTGDHARACRDWTEQRDHIAGPLGTELLSALVQHGWLRRDARTRAVRVTEAGAAELPRRLHVELP
ncbi:MAG: metalloregulator ArsR/SmtB family transcription factor [Actinomycetota bacterium]